MRVHVDVLGDTVIARRMIGVGDRGSDLSPAFGIILDAFEDWTGQQFATEGAFFGTPWEPLQDATIARKAQEGAADPTQPLVLSGALALSLQGGPGGVHEVGPEEALWGTRNPDAMWHHGRARSSDNPVPRRPIFELDEARRRWAMTVLQRRVFAT